MCFLNQIIKLKRKRRRRRRKKKRKKKKKKKKKKEHCISCWLVAQATAQSHLRGSQVQMSHTN